MFIKIKILEKKKSIKKIENNEKQNKNKSNPHKGLCIKKNQIIEAVVKRVDLKKSFLLYDGKFTLILPNSEKNKKEIKASDILKVKVLSIKKNAIIVSLKF